MNERMIELVIQARNYALDQKRHYERVHNTEQCLEEYREVYNEKFAELIVQECMKLNHDHFNDEDPYSIDSLYRYHFGFKE